MACRRKANRKRIQFAQKRKKRKKTNQLNKQKHKSPYFKRQQTTITKTLLKEFAARTLVISKVLPVELKLAVVAVTESSDCSIIL